MHEPKHKAKAIIEKQEKFQFHACNKYNISV